jgi:glycosyltransferase involved in cell wall biosynthesis
MKRFQYICADPGIPVPGTKGASIHVASVCHALRQAGLEGTIHAVRAKSEELEGYAVHPIAIPPNGGDESSSAREIRHFLANDPSQFSTAEKPDFIYERYGLWHFGGLARARALGVPFILEVNSPLPEEANRYRSLDHPSLADGVASVLMEAADGIVCVSQEVAAWVSRRRGHSNGVWVIPNGVDAELFAPRPESRPSPLPPRDVPLIAFSGSFRPWHGLAHLLNAFEIVIRDLPEAHLVCVGDGPERESFEAKVAERGLTDRVHVPGRVPHHEVPDWLGGADVSVAPYPALDDFYFSPLKIFEFMALGLPVVAAATGQIPELVPDGERGFLYHAGDSEDLASTILKVLGDSESATRCGATAYRWILDNATWERRVEEILDRAGKL